MYIYKLLNYFNGLKNV